MQTFNFSRDNNPSLNSNLGAAPVAQTPGGSYQGHHIIPVQAFSSNKVQKVIREGYTYIKTDFDVNDRKNGVYLPTTEAEARATNLAVHKGNSQLHNDYNALFSSVMDDLATKYTQFETRWVRKIGDSKAKNKTKLYEDLDKSIGRTLKTVIERKIIKNAESFLSEDRRFAVNFQDPVLKDYFISIKDSATADDFGSDEYDALVNTQAGKSEVRAFYAATPDYDVTARMLTGRISFKGVEVGDKNKRKLVMSPYSVKEIKKTALEFVEALKGKKGPVFLATTALAYYSMFQIAKDSIPEELNLSTADILELLDEAIREQIPEISDIFNVETLKQIAGDALTDPVLIAGLVIRLLVPSFGWAATLYEIVNNFDFIKSAVGLAWYAFDDPEGAFGAVISKLNELIDGVVGWAEWFGFELEAEDEDAVEETADFVTEDFLTQDEGLLVVNETVREAREDRGQSAEDILPADKTFDGIIRLAPESLNEGQAVDDTISVAEYLREQQAIREEFDAAQQAEFGDLGGDIALFGNDKANFIFGGLYDDVLNGGGGDDTLYASAGNDYIIGGKEDAEEFGDMVFYNNLNPYKDIDKDGEEVTYSFKRLTLQLGDEDVHMKVFKQYEGRASEIDRLAGIETIYLSPRTDNIVINGPADFIPTLWKINGGSDTSQSDFEVGNITVTNEAKVKSISIRETEGFNEGIGYLTDEAFADTVTIDDFRDVKFPKFIDNAIKHLKEQPKPQGADKKSEKPTDADNYVELYEVYANIFGSDKDEDFWSVGSTSRDIYGGDGNDVILLSDTRNTAKIKEDQSISDAFGGAGEDLIILNGEILRAYGGDDDDVLIGLLKRENGKAELAPSTLDGGAGDDVITIIGEKAGLAVGGAGRDFIFNRTDGGIIYGDTTDGLRVGPDDEPLSFEEFEALEFVDKDGKPGYDNSDKVWWWGSTTMWDPRRDDILEFFGYPLVGGNSNLPLVGLGFAYGVPGLSSVGLPLAFSPLYFDNFMPFITYLWNRDDSKLYVANLFISGFASLIGQDSVDDPAFGFMTLNNYNDARGILWGSQYFDESGLNQDVVGDMGMTFKIANPFLAIYAMIPGFPGGLNRYLPLLDELITRAGAVGRIAKAAKWETGKDPIVLDLGGDGIDTMDIGDVEVYFDVDGDLFAERTGWLNPEDGFLAIDRNGNNKIDNVGELFGNAQQSGYEELAMYDDNGDGKIDAADAIYQDLLIWQDLNLDGDTQEGELRTLTDIGITTINLDNVALGATTPQGAELLQTGTFVWDDGSVGAAFEAIFELNDINTKFDGEAGDAAWLQGEIIQSRGYGRLVDLSIAMSNDFELAEMVTAKTAEMTVANLKTLREQTGEILGQWSMSLEESRELTPVLLDTSGAAPVLLDRGVWVEDANGGYWTLHSGADITDAGGTVIARPTLQDVMALSGGWQIEQGFSASSRAEPLTARDALPYLIEVVDGRAVIQDYGVEVSTGVWALASGADITDADGTVIAAPTKDDILAMTAPEGQEWRVEDFAFNPYAQIPVENIGVNFIDGIVVDYTVQVTDQDGTFYVWARNLDRALELQDQFGTPREFVLRNFEVDFDTLDEVGSTDDSTFRVELLTPGQFHFATQTAGINFRPQMMTAEIDPATGIISYSVNESGQASLTDDGYTSGVEVMIELMGEIMDSYVLASRAFAARVALQGGLSSFAQGIEYNGDIDAFQATTDREMIPFFEAIFAGAPAGYDETFDYLTDWNEILWQVYPDFQQVAEDDPFGQPAGMDQRTIFQTIVAAYENTSMDVDIRAAMNTLSVNQDLLIDHDAAATAVDGNGATNFIYVSGGNQRYEGKGGSDVYFVGKDFGQDTIFDQDYKSPDELRFAQARSTDVSWERDGQDLIIRINGTDDELRVEAQFLGELNPLAGGGRLNSGMESIFFADGVVMDRFKIAMAVSEAKATNDVLIGSGDTDVLQGGLGNDFMQGRTGADHYIINRGEGQDVIHDSGGFGFGPLKGGLDFLHFYDGLEARDLHLTRESDSDDLLITLKDSEGNLTDDTVTVVGQFGGVRLNFELLAAIDPQLDVQYVAPDLIERFVFSNGDSLDFEQILERVLENAKTDGDDAIYGLLNNNTLDGGAGDDFLSGQEGGDTYIYGRDYGSDVIRDFDESSKLLGDGPDDVVEFVDDLRWTDFDFLRNGPGDTLQMRVKGTDDTLTFDEYFREIIIITDDVNQIEQFVFGDGTRWDQFKWLQTFIDQSKTDGDDTIYGFKVNDTIDGGLGDDRLEGQGGSDIYIYRAGDGSDTIFDAGGFERILFEGVASTDVSFSRTARDLIITIDATGETITLEQQYNRLGMQGNAVERFIFSDREVRHTDRNPEDMDLVGTSGSETLEGSDFNETIDGRAGDDTLIGHDGGDIYKFDSGYGDDVIIDRQVQAAWEDAPGIIVPEDDEVHFGDDVTRDNVIFSKDNDDLVVSISDRPDTLRIKNQFRDTADGVEKFVFEDGSFLLISDIEEDLQIEGGNRGDNVLTGSLTAENVLDGRQGDDTLIGGDLGDTYAFGGGYDFDEIRERADVAGVVDRVIFGATVVESSLKVSRNGNDLLIDLGNGADVLTITNGLTTTTIEEFLFADGTTRTTEHFRELLLKGTAGDDQLIGFNNRDDTLAGAGGSDALEGGGGNDTYLFGVGDLRDSVRDTSGVDRVVFAEGITPNLISFRDVNGDLLVTLTETGDNLIILGGTEANGGQHVETFEFADGQSLTLEDVRQIIFEQDSNFGMDLIDASLFDSDTPISGGRGFDSIQMGEDTRLIFAVGDGIDRVETPSRVETASIYLEGLSVADVTVRPAGLDSDDLVLSFPETGDQLVLVNARSRSQLPAIEFGDGTVWDTQTVQNIAVNSLIGDEDDIVLGSRLDDDIAGGKGDDDIAGGAGNDTFRFTRGDGRDVIADETGNDRLEIRGYLAEDLIVTRPVADRNELVLQFTGSDDEIVLRYTSNLSGVDSVTFGDGTTITRDALFSRTVGQGTPFDDDLTGTSASETFEGGLGDDVIAGGSGSDTYIFRRGDGRDVIDESGSSSNTNTLRLPDHYAAEISIRALEDSGNPARDAVVMLGGGDEVVLEDVLGTSRFTTRVNRIEFANGETWGVDEIRAAVAEFAAGGTPAVLQGTNADDVLTGTDADEIYDGLIGSDTFVYARGGGRDVINYETTTVTTDVLVLDGYDLADATFTRAPEDIGNLVIRFGDGDEVTVIDALNSDSRSSSTGWSRAIREYRFDDQSLTTEDIAALMQNANQTAGDDVIVGTELIETIAGGTGDDFIVIQGNMTRVSFDRSDTVVFARGDGQDQLVGLDQYDGDVTLKIEGYLPADVTLLAHPSDVEGFIVTFDGTNDRVEVRTSHPLYGDIIVDRIEFDNGTAWDLATIEASIQPLTGANATQGDDTLEGTSGDDIAPLGGDDVITANGANIVFAKGDGVDTVVTTFPNYAVTLTDINPDEVTLHVSPFVDDRGNAGLDYVLRVPATGDTLWLGGATSELDTITFANGDIWDQAAIVAAAQTYDIAATGGRAVTPLSTSQETHFVSTDADEQLGTGVDLSRFEIDGPSARDATFTYALGGGHDFVNSYTMISALATKAARSSVSS